MINVVVLNGFLDVLWMLLAFGGIAFVALLCYRYIPGLRVDKNDEKKDEAAIAEEELKRILVPMEEENIEVKKDDKEKE